MRKDNVITLDLNEIGVKNIIYFLVLFGFVYSCSPSDKGVEQMASDDEFASIDLVQLKSELDTIATASQKELLKNVSAAVEKGGTEYAVEFCNEEALPITNSLSIKYNTSISRITDKTRNPENNLKTEMDKSIFQAFQEKASLMDSLINGEDGLVYYKRINTALPACIKCHGNPESDIDAMTYSKIQSLYPTDLAISYKMDEFRGLWKLELED